MSARRIFWRGETYIAVEDAASCYGIATREIELWVDEELLDPPRSIKGVRAIRASDLDRIAALIRFTRVLGLETDVIRLLLYQ